MVLAALAAFAGSAVQSATGFGFALILGPALFAVLDPFEAVSALAVLGMVLNLLVLVDSPGSVRGTRLLPVLLGALPGIAVGVLVLATLSKPLLQIAVGLAVLAAILVRIHREAPEVPAEPLAGGLAVGMASGALTTSTSVSGPPLVLWLERQGLAPGELRATLAAAFLALNLVGALALLAAGGSARLAETGELVPLFGLTLLGYAAGAVAHRRIDPERFNRVVLWLVTLAGFASVVAGLGGIWTGG